MPKNFIRRHLPTPEKIANMRGLGFLRHRLQDPSLWHLNRRSASGAVFWGLWCAFLPMPLHAIPAIIAAIFFRFNLPLCLLLVWINNPITLIPILYSSYFVGSYFLPQAEPTVTPSMSDIQQVVSDVFFHHSATSNVHLGVYVEPVLLGMLVTGFVLACTDYMAMNYFWHYRVMKKWHKRHQKMANK
jgi:hypothetical protein